MSESFDLAVVGAGILGLATALAAAKRGLRVIVLDRDVQANGASVRNFGFVTVSGHERGAMWDRACRSASVWRQLAAAAGNRLSHDGVWISARRPASVAVMEAFVASDMGAGCRLLSPSAARRRCPQLLAPQLAAVLESTAELRVESREAIPLLAAWLNATYGVQFMRDTVVREIAPPVVQTSRGTVRAERVAVCPGDDFSWLYAERLQRHSLTRCKLQMLRLASPGFRLPATLMSDLGLGRYRGFADLEAAAPLKARLAAEQPEHVRNGVHLIVVQCADGSLIVGDSHHYATTPDAFSHQAIDELILDEFRDGLGFAPPPTVERWVGTYASAAHSPVLIDAPEPSVRLAIVTSGAGASTGFALGEELVESLFGGAPPGSDRGSG